jgi:lipopolysaccharide transport system ATP-binding protein
MTKKEIKYKFDDIVAFSGVDKFLDTPVKHYSSGMYVRLAFAVAAHLDADILLVDEVLSVGDAEFQQKCMGKMSDLANSGRTIILVSHNSQSIQELCSHVVYLSHGSVKRYGKTKEVMTEYVHDYQKNLNTIFTGPLAKTISIQSVTINGIKGKIPSINPKSPIEVIVKGSSVKKIDDIRITLSIYSNRTRIFTLHDSVKGIPLSKGEFNSAFTIPGGLLRPGEYDVYVGGHQVISKDWFYGEQIGTFNIQSIWSSPVDEFNIGLINIKGESRRE